jgi:hypothetical protein
MSFSKHLSVLAISFAVALPQVAAASTANVLSPANGAVVGPRFDIRSKEVNKCNLFGPPSITDSKGVSGGPPLVIYDGSAAFRMEGDVMIHSVDLSKPLVYDGQQPNPPRYVSPGKITIVFDSQTESGEMCSTTLTYTYQTPQAVQPAATTASTASTPTPTATPSVAQAAAPRVEAESGSLPAWAWVLIAVGVGGALLGLSEYSAVRKRS